MTRAPTDVDRRAAAARAVLTKAALDALTPVLADLEAKLRFEIVTGVLVQTIVASGKDRPSRQALMRRVGDLMRDLADTDLMNGLA